MTMNELQAMAIAALDAIKNDEGAELARLHKALHRASLNPSNYFGVEQASVTLGDTEARHRRICDAIDWLKALPQLDHMTTHKAAELRNRGYKDVGVVLQDELGSTAVIAHGKVTWTEPVRVTATIEQQSQFVPWTDKDVRELHAVLDGYPPEPIDNLRARFEQHDDFHMNLKRNPNGTYEDLDTGVSWIIFQSGYHAALNPTQHHIANVNEMVQPAKEDDWITWNGGECPVDVMAVVEYKLGGSPGFVNESVAGFLEWTHAAIAPSDHIIEYRIKTPVRDAQS